MQGEHIFPPLLLVVGLALAVPLVLARFKRLRLPIVVGEILAGIVIGRSGFGLVTHDNTLLNLLAELGFVFLMFLSGMEVDFSSLTVSRSTLSGPAPRRWGPLPIAAVSFALTLGLSLLVGVGLWRLGMVLNPWMMALILSTTSLGVVVPVLKERGLSSGQYGQTLVIAALVADFLTMLLITVVVGLLSRGAAARILLIGVLFAAVFLMYRLGLVINRVKAIRRTLQELSHATAQIKVRAAFALMLVFVALSEVLGTEVILGAFMAGAIIAVLRTEEDERLLYQLEGVGFGFFVPVFFIMVGVDFDLRTLFSSTESLWLLPMLLSAAVLVKLGPALVFRLAFGWRETLAAGVLLSARLSLIIAAAAIGRQLGVISEPVNAAIILVAVVTVTAAPPLFAYLVPGRDPSVPRPIVVVGAGELGLLVAQSLRAHLEQVVVVDGDPARVARAQRQGFDAIAADAESHDPRLAPYLNGAQALVCTDDDTERNFRICQYVRGTYRLENIVAQVTATSELARFRQLRVTTMNAALDRASLLVMLVRNPAAYALLTRTDDDKEVYEFRVAGSGLVGKSIGDLSLPGDVLAVALRRGGELLVPHRNTRLEAGDHLTLVGSIDAIQQMRGRPVDSAPRLR
jgi:Kef-type K+ transport system membrane component KefB/Trk K+ transport system NAD-binding subunit